MPRPAPTGSPRSMPLRSALRDDSERTPPLNGQPKAVQIADPDVSAVQEAPPVPPVEDPVPRKQFPASVAAKRLSGRAAVVVPPLPPPPPSSSSSASVLPSASVAGQASGEGSGGPPPLMTASPQQLPADAPTAALSTASSASPSLWPHAHPLQPHTHPLQHHHHRRRPVDPVSSRLLTQVAAWVEHEKEKRAARKARHVYAYGSRKGKAAAAAAAATAATAAAAAVDAASAAVEAVGSPKRRLREARAAAGDGAAVDEDDNDDDDGNAPPRRPRHHHQRAPSTGSASSEVSLDRLQRILDDSMAALGLESPASLASLASLAGSSHGGGGGGGGGGGSSSSRRHSRALKYQLNRTASSDTDYVDGDVLVPSCDAVLDNSKTLAAGDGGGGGGGGPADAARQAQAWVAFKNEIIRLAHTLRLKGWRRVPLDAGDTIWVERLSGALTNAVYEVSPPAVLPGGEGSGRQPSKLLLRIYGPQVEHLIDREDELSVLRRLARKKIGPRLLGTFGNGRFEQFFTATTLTAATLREPDTSRQIAKRMRELHDGIALLEAERDGGPGVWRKWDRWQDAVARRIAVLDAAVAARRDATGGAAGEDWTARGFVCGVPWPQFKALVAQQRARVLQAYGGPRRIRDQLVFAHSDTQYGNILRLRPDEKSPLLEPANEHKQLIVIDFEYAGANPPGVEFANHFTEWMFNYHDAAAPHTSHPHRYPTPEEQRRFLRAYVDHRPALPPAGSGSGSTPRFGPTAVGATTPVPATAGTPVLAPVSSAASSIVDFMLDARAPPGGWAEEDRRREDAVERRVDELMAETRLWRTANSAQWAAWGIVQAKVVGLEDEDKDAAAAAAAAAAASEDAFDYLGYAQQQALFFLGDCVQDGLVRLDELPADVRPRVKMVAY